MSIIKCPECNHEVSSLAKNCPFCGVDIAGNIIVCPDCGKTLLRGVDVCPNCKCDLHNTPVIPCSLNNSVEQNTKQPPQMPSPTKKSFWILMNKVPTLPKFCPLCAKLKVTPLITDDRSITRDKLCFCG